MGAQQDADSVKAADAPLTANEVSGATEAWKHAEACALDAIYGEGSASRVSESKVLIVGAGGVGCEVLKNVAFAGFKTATVIDLDTIDVSNLNRQFLFRRDHVGKPKAETAASAIRTMQPAISIEGIVANIKDPRFDVKYFKSFNIVCNALDNLDARRHVNRMCLAANVPLVESGSTGYNGQCSVHSPQVECYDCTSRPPTKSYAVCTIRSTPEKPVHCIVWAKSLWDLIFGQDDDGNVLADLDGGGESSEGAQSHNPDGSLEGDRKKTVPENKPAKRVRYSYPEVAHEFADRVCARVFVDDIADQIAMENLWTTRTPPIIIDVPSVCGNDSVDLAKINLLEQRVWDRDECARIVRAVLIHVAESRFKEIGSLSFDKDDRDALAFVVAAANLRAHAYGVPLSTPFAVKGIAGNIVHAIATTNAVVGGLVCLEALKVVANKGSVDNSRTTFVTRKLTGSRVRKLLNPEPLRKPKTTCFVCSKGQLVLTIDTEKTTLKMLVDNVLGKKLSVIEPSIYLAAGSFHNTLLECGEGLEEDEVEMYSANMKKKLSDLHIDSGSQLNIEDLRQNLKCVLHVTHKTGCEDDKPIANRFTLEGATPVVGKSNGALRTGVYEGPDLNVHNVDDEDELVIVDEPEKNATKSESIPLAKVSIIDMNDGKDLNDNSSQIVAGNGDASVQNRSESRKRRTEDSSNDSEHAAKKAKVNHTNESAAK